MQGTGSAELSRPLSSGSLAAEIPELQSTGVAVTSTAFAGVDVLLTVTKQGGAEEAEALLSDSLSMEQVVTVTLAPALSRSLSIVQIATVTLALRQIIVRSPTLLSIRRLTTQVNS